MNEEYKDNPDYQNGYYWGKNTAKFIERTTYGTLENAIKIKEELLDDFEEHFKWNMDNREYAETKGMVDAIKEILSEQNNEADEQRSNSSGSTS